MVVSLTVGLSLASRSIINLRNTEDEESSQRAFSAAEAGVERALKANCTDTQGCSLTGAFATTENNSQFSAIATPILGDEFLLKGGNPTLKDDGVDLWLVNHNADDSLDYASGWQTLNGASHITFYWGKSSDVCSNSSSNTMAALEIIAITGTASSPQSTRYSVDPCDGRRTINNFSDSEKGSPGPYSVGGETFAYKKSITINASSKGIVVRVVPLYADVKIAVKGCDTNGSPSSCTALPLQGSAITSTGTSGDTQRKIALVQGYPELPAEFFQYILFVTK